MEREIVFRGKREDNGEWVYGFYAHLPSAGGSAHIIFEPAGNPDESNQTCFIDPSTLGQYTGMADKNGKKIFEGDIVVTPWDGWSNGRVVHYENGMFKAGTTTLCSFVGLDSPKYHCEIIGNIHDNPELLRES